MSGSLRRSPFVLTVAIVLAVGACSPSAASPGAGSPAASASASAAASGPEESTVTGATCQQGSTEVKFWTEHTPPASDTMAAIVESFNQANPDICVKMTIVPGTETNIAKLLTSIRGGAAPDVYLADRFTVPQRASEGVLADFLRPARSRTSTSSSPGTRRSIKARPSRSRSTRTRGRCSTTRT